MEEDNLKQFKFPFVIRRVIALESCLNKIKSELCSDCVEAPHNAAYVIDANHPLGMLVQCTSCGYYQIVPKLPNY